VAVVLIVLVRSGAYGGGSVSLGQVLPDPLLSAESALLVLAMVIAGLLSRPFQVHAVQLLEGYWRESFLRTLAAELHVRRKRSAEYALRRLATSSPSAGTQLDDIAMRARREARRAALSKRVNRLLVSYPREDSDVMPTMLGNILLAGENRAGGRYGLDANAMYPRLFQVLPAETQKRMGQELDQLDAAAGLCLALLTMTGLATPLMLRFDAWSLLPLVSILLALVAYRGALRTASYHTLQLAVAFDLYRFDLLKSMHLPLPASMDREFAFNTSLTEALKKPGPLKDALETRSYAHSEQEQPVWTPRGGFVRRRRSR
jgi:hypothetical protein